MPVAAPWTSTRGLYAADDRQRAILDRDGSAPNAVVGVFPVTVERLQREGALALVFFGFHLRQKAGKLVADKQQSVRVFVQQLTKLLDRGVIDDQARA